MAFQANKEECIGCGACTNVCPTGAAEILDGVCVINENVCINCGACSAACPVGAIYESDNMPAAKKEEPKVKIVHFYADWCGPCKQMEPELAEFHKYHPEIEIEDFNVDNSPDEAQKYGVMSIPVLVYEIDGKEMIRNIGFANKVLIEAKLAEALNIAKKN